MVNITIVDDRIVEGNETFNMSLTVPSQSHGIVAGLLTSAVGIIIDSTSKKIYISYTAAS